MGVMQAADKTGHHHPPEALDRRSSAAGLRAVAIFEAGKGLLVLTLGLGLLSLLHKDVEGAAESLLAHVHLHQDGRLSRIFLDAASRATDARLWGLAVAAVAYAAVRFIEACGLWTRRVWAEWFALLSGALYMPWEILKIAERPNAFHFGVLAVNLAIVAYMALVRVQACRLPPCEDKP
jgi:uncharacterized membrane protein (DUF2068 family)